LKLGFWSFSGIWNLKFGILKLVLLTVLCPSQLRAQTNLAKPGPHSNRYLLIVETSRAMERRSEAALKVAQGLLVSGMNGQLQRGDSLGVWTFNEELYAGRLALQPWSPEAPAQKAVASARSTSSKARNLKSRPT